LQVEGQKPEMPADIWDGVLVLGETKHNELVTLPMHFDGEVRLNLTMREDGGELLISGTGMTVEVVGEFRFLERVPFNPFG
jgi:hypothetical protein